MTKKGYPLTTTKEIRPNKADFFLGLEIGNDLYISIVAFCIALFYMPHWS